MEDTNTEEIIRKSIADGISFTVIHEEKFKQNELTVSFLLPLSKETASRNALIPLVMRHGCGDYPDMTALNRRLKELYGARIDGSTSKRGEVQVVTIYCECLADRYAFGGENVLESCAALLKSVIFDPAFENGVFKQEDVEIEKRNLNDQIDSILNDKRHYATMKLKEAMCADEAYGVFELGSKESVAAITPQSLTHAWKEILAHARVEMILAGSGDAGKVEALFAQAFASCGRGELSAPQTTLGGRPDTVKTVVERLPVSQAKLVMGLRADITPENGDAIHLATAILGGSPHSRLFANVREKMSLCYYCMSYLERQKGIVFIDSGIEEENYEKARAEILAQLDAVKQGQFTDDDMHFAKLYLQNSYTQLSDSLDSLVSYYLSQAVAGKVRSPKEVSDSIMAKTREETVDAANGILLDTVYLLAGIKEGA